MASDESKIISVIEEAVNQEGLSNTSATAYNDKLRAVGGNTLFQLFAFTVSGYKSLFHILLFFCKGNHKISNMTKK